MKKHYYIALFILLNSSLSWAIGNPTDSTAVEKKQEKIAITNLGQLNQVLQQYKTRQQNAGAPYRSFPSLDNYTTTTAAGSLDDVADFTKEKLKQWFDNKASNKADTLVYSAKQLFKEIEQHGKFISQMTDKESLKYLKRRQVVSDYKNIYERGWASLKATYPFLYIYVNNDDFYTKYTTDYKSSNGEIEIKKNYAFGFSTSTIDEFDLNPFDLIFYRSTSSIGALREYKTKELIPLPAIVLYFDDNQQGVTTTGESIQLAFDVATLVIPGAQITKLKDIGKVIYILDKVSSATSIAASATQAYDPEAAKTLNQISLLLGLVDMGNLTTKGVKKYFRSLEKTTTDYKKAIKLVNENAEQLTKLPKEAKQQLNTILAVENKALKDAGVTIELSSVNKALNSLANAVDDFSHFLDDAFVLSKRAEVIAENLPTQFPNLTIDELTAVKVYTSSQKRNGIKIYKALNTQLRAGSLDDYYQGLHKLLNDGLSKMTPYNGATVFRGCGSVESQIARGWSVGDEIKFNDFKSASTASTEAGDFVKRGNGDVIYEISNPVGYNVCPISCSPDEMEILFRTGGKFKVMEVIDNVVIYDKNFNVVTSSGRKIKFQFKDYE